MNVLFTSSNRELLDRPLSVVKQPCIDFTTFDEFLKQLQRLSFVLVNFPESAGAAVLSVIINETFHIAVRISEEKSNFMWKSVTICKPFL